MTPAKEPTVSDLLRKVQQLEAQIAELLEAVDLRLRIHCAQAILNGEDE